MTIESSTQRSLSIAEHQVSQLRTGSVLDIGEALKILKRQDKKRKKLKEKNQVYS